jgi:ubiquinone/menaquinone biosynthesis C-methylase UbiE
VLEIGCGIGTDTINFAREGAIVTAIDISKESLKLAEQRAKVFNLDNKITFVHSNAEELSQSIAPSKFDLIYSFGVIHHTENPDNAISEIKKYSNEDTDLRIMLYARNSWKQYLIEAEMEQPEAQAGCIIANTYTTEEIESLLDGFHIYNIEQTHIFPYIIKKYIQYEYEKQPWFASMPEELFKTLEKRLGWHMLIKAKLK